MSDTSINHQSTIYFDGNDDELRMNRTIRYAQPNTYYFLCKLSSPAHANTSIIFCGESEFYRNQCGYNPTAQTILIFAGGQQSIYANVTFPINFDYTQFVAHYNTTNSKVTKNDTCILTGDPGNYTMQGLVLGNVFISRYNMRGNMPEFIYYNANIDSGYHQYLSHFAGCGTSWRFYSLG